MQHYSSIYPLLIITVSIPHPVSLLITAPQLVCADSRAAGIFVLLALMTCRLLVTQLLCWAQHTAPAAPVCVSALLTTRPGSSVAVGGHEDECEPFQLCLMLCMELSLSCCWIRSDSSQCWAGTAHTADLVQLISPRNEALLGSFGKLCQSLTPSMPGARSQKAAFIHQKFRRADFPIIYGLNEVAENNQVCRKGWGEKLFTK